MSQKFKFYFIVSLQIILILGMIVVHQVALVSGTKIFLKITPLDPRSLFSGYYAQLNYEISRIFTPDIEVDDDKFVRGEYIYAILTKEAHEKFYKIIAISHRRPLVRPGEFIIRGRVWNIWNNRNEHRIFIQTDEGRIIEHMAVWGGFKPGDRVAIYINENNQITEVVLKENEFKPLRKDGIEYGKVIDIKKRTGMQLTIKYGIENYFVEETKASSIDKELRGRETNLYAEISLGKDGRALVSRLFLNDRPLEY